MRLKKIQSHLLQIRGQLGIVNQQQIFFFLLYSEFFTLYLPERWHLLFGFLFHHQQVLLFL